MLRIAPLQRLLQSQMIVSNIPLDDAPEWSNVVTYNPGDRVYIAANMRVYEATATNINKAPFQSQNQPNPWVFVDRMNRWRAFDFSPGNPSMLELDAIHYLLELGGRVDVMHLFNLQAGSASVIIFDNDVALRNRITNSDVFQSSDHTRTRLTVDANGIRDPHGARQADTLIENSDNNTHFIQFVNVSYTSGTEYTFSIWAKRGNLERDISMSLPSAPFPGAPSAAFNTETGAIIATADCTAGAIEDENGWWRFWLTATANATVSAAGGLAFMRSPAGPSYPGAGGTLLAYGAMNNVGPLAEYQWRQGTDQYGDISFRRRVDLQPFGRAVTQYAFQDLPGKPGDFARVTVFGADGVSTVGEITLGESFPMGKLLEGTETSFTDFSERQRNAFGQFDLINRGYARDAKYQVWLNKRDLGAVIDLLASVSTNTCVFYDDRLDPAYGLTTIGLPFTAPSTLFPGRRALLTLTVEGRA